MKIYQSISGMKVFASSPDNASVNFCKEAEKVGIFLYEARKFNPDKISFDTVGKFFSKIGLRAIIADKDSVLILPIDSSNTNTGVSNGYGVATKTSFDKWYKVIENNQDADMPKKTLTGKSFYLDAGHGGKDSGAVNDNLGLQEKIAALDVCLKLGERLEAQGAKIYYSRTDNDSYPALSARASEANSKNVTAFISIHLNSAENKSASGIETLVYALKGTAYNLAEKVQNEMIKATGWINRGVKERPNLTVLKKTKMPAILCEIGFISNDSQATELFSALVQNKIANAIAKGIIDQYGA